MSIMQKKLMQKYYGQDIQPPSSNLPKKMAQRPNAEIGYFDYTDRGTREFMKGTFPQG